MTSSSRSTHAVRRRVVLASLGALAGVGALAPWRSETRAAAHDRLSFDDFVDHVLPMAEERAQLQARDDESYLRRLAALAARTGWEPDAPFAEGGSVKPLMERHPVAFMLFQLPRGERIPLHDHRGYCALMKVLSGTPTLTEYAPVQPIDRRADEPFEVRRAARRRLAPGSLAAASSEHAPLHSIDCADDDVQFVDIFSFHEAPRSRLVYVEDHDAERAVARWGNLM